MSKYTERKQSLGIEWIKSNESGRTYLCPAGSIANRSSASEQELRAACVDESDNPQND